MALEKLSLLFYITAIILSAVGIVLMHMEEKKKQKEEKKGYLTDGRLVI